MPGNAGVALFTRAIAVAAIVSSTLSSPAQAQTAGQASGAAHDAGALLASTDLYDLFERRSSQGLCRGGYANIVMVFKVDETYTIAIDDAYRMRLERDVLPLLRTRCTPLTQLTIYHHVRGFVLGNTGAFTYDDAASAGREVPLAVFSLPIDDPVRLTIPGGITGQRYSVAAYRERVIGRRAAERTAQDERRRELQTAAAAGQYPTLVNGIEYFFKSNDRNAVCGDSIDVTMRARDRASWELQQLTATRIRAHATSIQTFYCKRSTERTMFNFTLLAGEEVVRRIAIDSEGLMKETFVDPAQLRNPSGETLHTSDLFHGPFLDHLFFGRFEYLRQEDPGRGHFSWLYTDLIELYGRRYREHLKGPLVTMEVSLVRGGVREGTPELFEMEQRVMESWRRERDNVSGVIGGPRYRADITAILTRHAPPSKALAQLYENFYRYATNQPPVQDQR